ncbi:S8 family serine peptidase, partial [Streptococcus pneumoniae]|uniref:S8 family serine peptidase n=1 Tax=Streptococcus pneumoniae TaxID=1313 RepID=UPI0012D847C7
ETPGDGIDNDANGFIDDINGYDFLNNDATVYDSGEHPHGTHVAGTIGAVGGNGIGVTGVTWNVSLISAKIVNANGQASIADAIEA